MPDINDRPRYNEAERRELRNAIIVAGFDDWNRRRLKRAQIEDIAERVIESKRVMLDSWGNLQGSDISLVVDELADDSGNKHLFRDLDAPAEESKPDLPNNLTRMSARERLDYANSQAFSDKRRRGESA